MNMVLCRLPKAGLGNQLFSMMKTLVFAELNNLPFTVVGYYKLNVGTYLRGERSKRNYINYFTFQKTLPGELLDRIKVSRINKNEIVNEPNLSKLDALPQNAVYQFTKIPHWSDYFFELKDYRSLVIKLFLQNISESIKDKLASQKTPVIGVHIRMGDFKKLQQGQDFKKVGATRTPEEYFINVIKSIRHVAGKNLPVTIFTDGNPSEFTNLLDLQAISIAEGNSDIVDMLLLSKSKIIVPSAGSTFSYWSGFLSDSPIIMHPDHIHKPLRDDQTRTLFEGPFDVNNASLISQIQNIAQ
jgi:hypothetical protein